MSSFGKWILMRNDEEKMNADESVRNDRENAQGRVDPREREAILIASLRDLTHAQLIGRDLELGLRAELMQAKIDLKHARERANHDLIVTRQSTTWRVGRMAMRPLVFARRVLKRVRRMVRR